MEVRELMSKVFSAPAAGSSPGIGAAPLGGVEPKPVPTKATAFNANIMSEAQKTFQAPAPNAGTQSAGAPATPNPNQGTAGNLIPPGWSSQAKQGG